MTTLPIHSAQELAEERTDMAASRTLMAADRTLMAWVRTSLSLFSFGFTIYKVLEGLQSQGVFTGVATPRNVGMFMAMTGTLAILMGTIEYWQSMLMMRVLRPVALARRPTFVMAILMFIAGIVLFSGIVARII